jgi:hypothetical protein
VAAFAALDDGDESNTEAGSPVRLPRWIIPVLIYAALISPLPDLSFTDTIKDMLFIG